MPTSDGSDGRVHERPGRTQRKSSFRRRLAILLAVATAALAWSSPAWAATFVVNSFDDVVLGGCDAIHCSLREAITASNANPGSDLIAFNIVGPAPHSIKPLSQLPFITDPVTIDGTTEPGYAGSPVIEVDGSLAGLSSAGFLILAGNSTIRALVINRFNFAGIHMQQGGGNRVVGNYLGTDLTGTIAAENRFASVDIFGADDNVIGGTTPADRNLISGNITAGTGVEIRSGVAEGVASGNSVLGNYIGTDVTGTLPLGNRAGGVIVGGNNNVIGGTSVGARNVIAGNGSDGVRIGGSGNVVQGNYIGVNVTGVVPLGNSNGLEINNGANNLIGGISAGSGNVISGNRQEGLQIANSGATGNVVQGNLIGTDATGTVGLGNGPGFRGIVVAYGPTNNTNGGT
jgi:CSLREA domain-containing protein